MLVTTLKKLELLQSIGYIDNLPLSIRATEQFELLSAEQILKRADINIKPSKEARVLSAAETHFPLVGESDFELIVDDDFLSQKRGIKIENCHRFKLNFSEIYQKLHGARKNFIEITLSSDFTIENLDLVGGRNTLVVSQSEKFQIKKCCIQKAEGYAIIIHNSQYFQVTDSLFKKNLASGLMIVGDSRYGLIDRCQIYGSTGYFNCDAGLHLCATSDQITLADIPENCHETLTINKKTSRPHAIAIVNGIFSQNRAQGIYSEGASNCLFKFNKIHANNKEGICFDWGSNDNIFENNSVALNGERDKLLAHEMVVDFIEDAPVLRDGSSSAKLPGISIDNGCSNLIIGNRVDKNYGGGIKFVRSALLNKVSQNLITRNVKGVNPFKFLFYAIYAGGSGNVNQEFSDENTGLLDFIPSQLNRFTQNVIWGHTTRLSYQFNLQHKSEIFSDKKSTGNIAEGNVMRYRHVLLCCLQFYCRWVSNVFRQMLKRQS